MCDDGSHDNTFDIAQKYVTAHPNKFILLKNEENVGLNKTLNKCLSVAKGNYIARMDGDDISLPQRFEKELSVLESHPEFALVGTAMIRFDSDGDWSTTNVIEFPTKKDFIKHSPFFNHATVMIRKDVMLDVEGYSEDKRTLRFEDCNLWHKIYSKNYKGMNIKEPLYKMRDDKNAYIRRSLKSRINVAYIDYTGYKMNHMPLYAYLHIIPNFIKNVLLSIIPEKIYMYSHRNKK
jgi:glycosyltransferase EpsE